MAKIAIHSKTYGEKIILVDDADFNWLNQWKWYASKRKKTFYAVRNDTTNGHQIIRMHRVLLGLTDSNVLCDHKDGDGLNNQRNNLRVATNAQNTANRRSKIGSSSKYLGVCFRKKQKKWNAQIKTGNKITFLGLFENEQEAAIAYNNAAVKIHGEFAGLNKI